MKITLYSNHPAEGSLSMIRYAHSLKAALKNTLPNGWTVSMPLPPAPPSIGGVYGKIIFRTLVYPFWVKQHQGDINHVIDHSYGHLLFGLDKQKTVVTVHDVAPLHFQPRSLGLSTTAWRLAWQGVKSAQFVIVDSRFIQQELADHLSLPADNFLQIPLAVSGGFRPTSIENQSRLRKKYLYDDEFMLLHVGHMQPRKNLDTLFHTIALLRQQSMPVRLIQVGGAPTDIQNRLIQKLQIAPFINFIGRIPADEDNVSRLSELYSAADVFVFPSLYEGFGMPVLEAMACGTPVVASHSASLPQVVGDAGLLADPSIPSHFVKQINDLVTNNTLRQSLIEKGLKRARQFSWENTAKQTWAAYQRILEHSR